MISASDERKLGGAARSCWVARAGLEHGLEGPLEEKPLPLELMRGLEGLSPSSIGTVGQVWREGRPVRVMRRSWEATDCMAGGSICPSPHSLSAPSEASMGL